MNVRNFPGTRYQYAQELVTQLSQERELVVYDVGAGECQMRDLLAGDAIKLREFDLIPKDHRVTELNIEKTAPEPNQADLVLVMDVLEHCLNPGKALQNIVASMRPGSFILLTMPNPLWSKARLLFLGSGELPCFTKRDLESNHHVFTSWPHIVQWMIEQNGLVVREYVTLESKLEFPGRILSFSFPVRFGVWILARIVELLDPATKGINYGLVAQWPHES